MKTVSDNEIIDTSRGHKRIGAVFDENAMLRASNADLLAALEACVSIFDIDAVRDAYNGKSSFDDAHEYARAAIARARGQE